VIAGRSLDVGSAGPVSVAQLLTYFPVGLLLRG